MRICVVIPTIRLKNYLDFRKSWSDLFKKHDVDLITVFDGEKPYLEYQDKKYSIHDVMGEYEDCIFNLNSGIRNAGFALAYKLFKPDIYYTLDDDETPIGDPIQDHILALSMRVPVSWMKVGSEFTRGFPYGIRDETPVVLSHGVWEGYADWDAPTQLVLGNRKMDFYKGVIPKGIYFPMCIMNLAFKPEVLPYIYQPPMGEKAGIWRFDDIWSGVVTKRAIDENRWAAVTGYARVYHQRASNVWTNIRHEGTGLELNETFWLGDETDPYFKLYEEKLSRWREFLEKYK